VAPTRGQVSSEPVARRPRTRLAPNERQHRLLEVAAEEFAQAPYEQIRITDIAERAGVSKALLFRYFATKRELYLECVRADSAKLAEAVDIDLDMPAAERFPRALEVLLEFIERHPYSIPARPAGELRRHKQAVREIVRINEQLISRIIERMGVGVGNPELHLAVESWLLFARTSARRWTETRPFPRQRLIDLQIAAFRGAAAEALEVEAKPTPAGGAPPFLP
jgi:AcrR family transcriptional regulator